MQISNKQQHRQLFNLFTYVLLVCVVAKAPGSNDVAILKYSLPNQELSFIEDISQELTNKGFIVSCLTPAQVADPSVLSADKFCLYIVPNATCYPAIAFENLNNYLKNKGNILLLSAPIFQNALVESQGKWVDEKILEDSKFSSSQKIAPIETLVPTYKGYDIENFDSIKSRANRGSIDYNESFKSAWCSQKRTASTGLSGSPKFRYIPLAEAFDKDAGRKGTIAWILLNRLGEFDGAAFACIGLNDLDKYKDKPVIEMVTQIVESFRDGLFLYRAGAEHFSYNAGEKVKLGCEIVNRTKESKDAEIKITVTSDGKVVFEDMKIDSIPAMGLKELFTDYQLTGDSNKFFNVKVELIKDGKTIDSLSHELTVLENTTHSKNEFVTVKGPDFYLNGQKWYPVGVNYWPQYVSGLDRSIYWSNWLKPGQYDPALIEEDLEIMQQLGINMVSIQIKNYISGHNLVDFLRRCEKRDIKANLAMVENVKASPIDFEPTQAEKLIKDYDLANNPTIFAYDIIWEPGNYAFNKRNRAKYNNDWHNWIIERYGSISNAETDWNYKITDETGEITHPSDEQLKEDGDYRIMVAAYRRFMDDFMSKKWNIATQKLRELLPNQLISYRQGNTLPHDFTITATAKHVDFFCPEGYAIAGGEDGFNTACFLSRYIDFVTGGKPIIWSEFGVSVWDNKRNSPDQSRIDYQTQYNEIFYKVVLETGCNGIAPWWWPGGFREGEYSDYGLLNLDASPRPSIQLLKKYAPMMKKPRNRPKADEFITIDRDENSGGYWYLAFYQGKDQYAKLKEQGKMMGIKTAGTGTDSTNTPLLAVGNTKYNGNNPPKFLNAEFNYFKIKDESGTWIDVKKGGIVLVSKKQPILAKISIGNLQEAKWISPQNSSSKQGGVYLSSTIVSSLKIRVPIVKDVDYLEDAAIDEFILADSLTNDTEVFLQMNADKRACFGEVLNFTLIPK